MLPLHTGGRGLARYLFQCQVLLATARYCCHILLATARYCMLLPCTARYRQVMCATACVMLTLSREPATALTSRGLCEGVCNSPHLYLPAHIPGECESTLTPLPALQPATACPLACYYLPLDLLLPALRPATACPSACYCLPLGLLLPAP